MPAALSVSLVVCLTCSGCTDVPVSRLRGATTSAVRPPDAPTGADAVMTSVAEAAPETYNLPEAPQTVPPGVEWGPQLSAPTGPASPARAALRPSATYRLLAGHEWLEQSPAADTRVVVELTIPSRGWYLEKGAVVTGQVGDRPDVAGVRALVVDRVATGGCDRLQRRWVDPGPSPADLARALLENYGFDVLLPPEPVRAFGHDGVHLVLQLRAEPDATRCLDFNLATYRSMAWFAEIVELWIVDVDGRRVIIERSSFPQTSERVLYQQHVIVASLRILVP